MLAVLVLALALAPLDGPPISTQTCFDGRCITHSYPRDYIVFFGDGSRKLDTEGLAHLREFGAQHQWWPHLIPKVCLAAEDPLGRARKRHIRQELARAGYRTVAFEREGKGCEISGGSRRAPGRTAYYLVL